MVVATRSFQPRHAPRLLPSSYSAVLDGPASLRKARMLIAAQIRPNVCVRKNRGSRHLRHAGLLLYVLAILAICPRVCVSEELTVPEAEAIARDAKIGRAHV